MFETIVLAAPVYDPAGWLELRTVDRSGSDTAALSRRVTRTATLDGGASVNDAGYSPADRTVLLNLDPTTDADTVEAVRRLLRIYSTLLLSMRDGLFYAAPSTYRVTNGKATLTLLITEAVVETY